jgi:hypothetical protein
MPIIDFANSYVTFFGKAGGNVARIQLDAACTIVDSVAGTAETFYLSSACRAELMYLDTPLFKMPSYEFCGIFSDRDHLLLRTHWSSERDERDFALNRERFEDVQLDVRTFEADRSLDDAAAVVGATLASRPLVGRTTIHSEETRRLASLEYPIKTMNVLREPSRFQVDTGPLLVPDFRSTATRTIEQLQLAYIVYNRFDRAELILRAPTPLPSADDPQVSTTDYSVPSIVAATNQIFCCA